MKIGMNKDQLSDGRDFDLTTVGGLLPGTTYYYKAFVKVDDGYVYGPVKQLTTKKQTMEYVDLGLSVTWAKCNIGAENEEGVGAYFGYGDKTAEQYSKDNADYSTVTSPTRNSTSPTTSTSTARSRSILRCRHSTR